jgi:hypothetical protein
MAYAIRGGKLRKQQEHGWTRLFDADYPIALVSRPPHFETHPYLRTFAGHVAEMVAKGKPALCASSKHDYEFHSLPDVFAVVQMGKREPRIISGICPECAKKTDAELLDIFRTDLIDRGIDKDMRGGPTTETQMANAVYIDALPNLSIAIGLDDPSDECDPATLLCTLLRADKLVRFMAFRNGVRNCHTIVSQLRLDFKELGVENMFAYKRGSCAPLVSDYDPNGLHSWIEADGWAIDASNMALGNPICVQRVDAFRKRIQATNVHDIEGDVS